MTPTNPQQLTAPGQAQRTISDGAHSSGNPEVFFLPPMVGNPSGVSTFNDAFQPGLPASILITDVTPGNTFTPITLPLAVDLTGPFYAVNWDTKATALNIADTYRINVKVGSKIIAFADVDLVSNGSGLKRVDTQDFIGLVDGRTLPIKVRINQGWNCVNRATCVTQVVPNTIPTGQTVIVSTGGALPNSVAFTGTWNGGNATEVVTIEDVTAQFSTANGGPGCNGGLAIQLSQEHCVRVTIDPEVVLTAPITVGTCLALTGDPHQELAKLDVNQNPAIEILQDAAPPVVCPPQIGSTIRSSNPLVRLASGALTRIGRGIGWALGLKTAFAFDLGVGATVDAGTTCCSLFVPVLPEHLALVSGDGQTATVGSAVPNELLVTVLYDHDVKQPPAFNANASVTCQALPDGQVSPATNKGNGIYSCGTPVLGAGANQFKATLVGLPDQVLFDLAGGETSGLNETVTFTETGTAAQLITFDEVQAGTNLSTSNPYSGRGILSFGWTGNPSAAACGTTVFTNSASDNVFPGNVVTLCAPGTASDISENTFGAIVVTFANGEIGAVRSQVCIDAGGPPDDSRFQGFLEIYDINGALIGSRVTSTVAATSPTTLCATGTGIASAHFSGNGGEFSIFKNLSFK